MILLDWYKQFLHIRAEHKGYLIALNEEAHRPCESCENLKIQLEAANLREQKLIEALTRINEPVKEVVSAVMPQPLRPRHVPFSVRRQELERESRQAAAILSKKMDEMKQEGEKSLHIKAPAVSSISTEELEKELDLVADERESNNGERNGTE